MGVQQTADSYLPLVVISKVKTLLNIIWWYSERWDKLMQRRVQNPGEKQSNKVRSVQGNMNEDGASSMENISDSVL